MKSIRALIGMPVISIDGGRRLGRVLRASVNEALDGLEGIWIAGRFGKTAFLPKESIEMLGDVAVIVNSLMKVKPRGQAFHMRRALDASGALMGAVTGLYVNEESLTVESLEISLGFWEDIARGRQLVRHFAVLKPQGDVIVCGKGEDVSEKGLGSRYGCGRDDRRIRGDGVRDDELADGAENGPRGDECGESHCQKNP